jgi:hypothetical protein
MPADVFSTAAAPDSSLPIKFLVNGEAINAGAETRRFKHEGRWTFRMPKDGEALFTTKPIAELSTTDSTWVSLDEGDTGSERRAPLFGSVPLPQNLLGVWRRSKEITLVLSIPTELRPLVKDETGGLLSPERFYQQHNEFNSSCFRTCTEYNFPSGLDESPSEWDNKAQRFVPTSHALELLWWRDEEAKAALSADMRSYKERHGAFIAATVERKQAAQGIGIQLLLGGTACCEKLSCESCLVSLHRSCACAPYQHHWFFKWHEGPEVTQDPSATATPTSTTRGNTTTCKWSWAQCCCPLWPLLPCICLCVGPADDGTRD